MSASIENRSFNLFWRIPEVGMNDLVRTSILSYDMWLISMIAKLGRIHQIQAMGVSFFNYNVSPS